MLGRPVKLEIPRRVTGCYLLFSLAAILWLGAGSIFVVRAMLYEQSDRRLFSYLDRVRNVTARDYALHGGGNLVVGSRALTGRQSRLRFLSCRTS